MAYQIIEEKHYNKHGDMFKSLFYIMKNRSIFGFNRWVRHKVWVRTGVASGYNMKKYYDTLEESEIALKKIINKRKLITARIESDVVKVLTESGKTV